MTKTTSLHATHQALGAKLIPFAGYDMPVRYEGDKQEHLTIRESAGVFDVSHMGEFLIRGPKALELVQQVTSNNAARLIPGKAQYSCLPNHEGGIVDDIIVYCLNDETYMIVANAANVQKDWDWISQTNASIGAEMIDQSEEMSLLAVSGPKAEEMIQPLCSADLSELGTYFWARSDFGSLEDLLIATTGYTGERTFEIFIPNDQAEIAWELLMDAGVKPCGLGARDTLRLEMGYMLYGNDINDTTSPLEAGLSWITKLKKGPFNGSDAIQKLKDEGLKRKLVGFAMQERGIPRSGYEIVWNGEIVGTVTSGGISPLTGQGIGLGYVPTAAAALGTELHIQVRKKQIPAKVVRPPFIEK
ncbi:MAG: glycine cleavage system aminomethyltransferase GcvT [Bacteroidota bacterium]